MTRMQATEVQDPWRLTYRGAVYPWNCDHVGHMNVMWYVGKFDEATWCFLADLGLTPGALRARGRGMAVRAAQEGGRGGTQL